MIQMARKNPLGKKPAPLERFRKPQRAAFNLIKFVCRECGARMKAKKSERVTTTYCCTGCGRRKKQGHRDVSPLPI